jgi:hypothetical protein
MKEVEVTIVGVSPLLMNKRPMVAEDEIKKKGDVIDAKTDALKKAHYDPKLGFYIPGDMIEAALREAGKNVKKGRGSASKTVTCSVFCKEDKIFLAKEYSDIDIRWGTHPSTGNSVSVHRCRFDNWKLTFTLQFNADRIDEKTVKFLIQEAGDIAGIGSYKPASKKGGKYGRWKLDKFVVKGDEGQ